MSVEVEEAKEFAMGFQEVEEVSTGIEEAEVATMVNNIGWWIGLLSSSFTSVSAVLDEIVEVARYYKLLDIPHTGCNIFEVTSDCDNANMVNHCEWERAWVAGSWECW